MWRPLLSWLLKFVLARLGEDLDESERTAVAEYEAKRQAVLDELAAGERDLATITATLFQNAARRRALAAEIDTAATQLDLMSKKLEKINETRKTVMSDLAARSDDDMLRSDF
ncbi:MAG TPA: hypothetical protein PLR83_00315 [Pyrinomonadaceae bacterium]|nr:hypothetical protein [Pyrinomonadaceae bacterium]